MKNIVLFTLFIALVSCTKSKTSTTPPKETSVAFAEENPKITAFLEHHFYNYEAFENPSSGFDNQVKIDTISGANVEKRSLMKDPNLKRIEVTIDKVVHTVYYIPIREGKGEHPTYADSIVVRYKGLGLNRSVFDERKLPVWLDLTSLVPGWRQVIPLAKTGVNPPVSNGDGTVTFGNDYGIGIMVFPSKLGYYNTSVSGISLYSPLVFAFHLLLKKATDHDGDGVLTIDEDIDKDRVFTDEDTDSDNRVNYLDTDDDGDGTPTKDEYDEDKDGKIDDADGDGIPDYLDKT